MHLGRYFTVPFLRGRKTLLDTGQGPVFCRSRFSFLFHGGTSETWMWVLSVTWLRSHISPISKYGVGFSRGKVKRCSSIPHGKRFQAKDKRRWLFYRVIREPRPALRRRRRRRLFVYYFVITNDLWNIHGPWYDSRKLRDNKFWMCKHH